MARHETPDARDRLEYWMFSGLLSVLRRSSLAGGQRRGRSFGRFVNRWVSIRRREAFSNLSHAFPERDEAWRRGVYREMCETMGITLAEFARFDRRDPEPLRELITLENHEAIARALAGGKGAVLLTAHFGNWEVLGAALAEAGYPMTVLGARQRNPLVEKRIDRMRGRRNVHSITVGKSLRPILEALRGGRCMATLADQDGGRQGFFLDVLGRRASVQSGIFRLVARAGTPMITGFACREGERWRGDIQDAVWPRPVSGPEGVEEEARRLAALYSKRVEARIREHPAHWWWVHRRWKTRPPEETPSPRR